MTRSKSSPEAIARAERLAKGLELRKAGMNYEDVARQCGWNSPHAAATAIRAAMKKMIQPATEEIRQTELNRLDALLMSIWGIARGGNLKAIETALRIMERRAKLIGLDAPSKVRVISEEAKKVAAEYGLDSYDVLEEAKRLVAERG